MKRAKRWNGLVAAPAMMVLAAGCEVGVEEARLRPGPGAAYAAEAPRDTVPTVTRRLLADPWIDWTASPSPDGGRLAHTEWNTGELALLELETGEAKRLTDANTEPYDVGMALFPLFSPDGRRIVYSWWEEASPFEWGLRVVRVDGGAPRPLFDRRPTPWINATDWSPDGRSLLALRSLEDGTNQLLVIGVEDGSVRLLRSFDWRAPNRARFSPDGRHVVYDFPPVEERAARDLYVLSLEEGREARLVEHPADDGLLGWSPDGGHVLFTSDRGGSPGAWLLPVSDGRRTGAPTLVKPDFWRTAPMAFLADGRYVYGVEVGDQNVYYATLDTAQARIVGSPLPAAPTPAGFAENAAWSRDGRWLAYRVRPWPPGGRFRLGIRSVETGEHREMAFPANVTYPRSLRWTPDGHAILFSSQDRTTRVGLYRLDVQTGRAERLFQLPPDRGLQQFDLAPDGRWIVYKGVRRRGDGTAEHELRRVDVDGGDERILLTSPHQARNPAISPDGRRVVFTHGHTLEDGGSELRILDLGSGLVRTVLRGVDARASAAWTPDGRHLVLADRPLAEDPEAAPSYQLKLLSLDGGEPRPLGVSATNLHRLDLAPDGKRVAYQAGRRRTEIWVMEGFLPPRTPRGAPGTGGGR